MISKRCSSTDNTRLPFLSSLSTRPNRAELSRQPARSCSSDGSTGTAARCPARLGLGEDFTRHRWYLQPESQAGKRSPPPPLRCSTPAEPRQVVWRMLQVRLLEAVRTDIRFCWWCPLGPHLEYLSSCTEPFPGASGITLEVFVWTRVLQKLKGHQKVKLRIFISSNKALKHLINFKRMNSLTKSGYLRTWN